jgi:hypothetical protein
MNLNYGGVDGIANADGGAQARERCGCISLEPDEYSDLLARKALPGSAGRAALRDWCDRADLLLMAVRDEKDGVLGAIRARIANPSAETPDYDLTRHELRTLA